MVQRQLENEATQLSFVETPDALRQLRIRDAAEPMLPRIRAKGQ